MAKPPSLLLLSKIIRIILVLGLILLVFTQLWLFNLNEQLNDSIKQNYQQTEQHNQIQINQFVNSKLSRYTTLFNAISAFYSAKISKINSIIFLDNLVNELDYVDHIYLQDPTGTIIYNNTRYQSSMTGNPLSQSNTSNQSIDISPPYIDSATNEKVFNLTWSIYDQQGQYHAHATIVINNKLFNELNQILPNKGFALTIHSNVNQQLYFGNQISNEQIPVQHITVANTPFVFSIYDNPAVLSFAKRIQQRQTRINNVIVTAIIFLVILLLISIYMIAAQHTSLQRYIEANKHDDLTGLHNRPEFLSILEREFNRAKRYQHKLSLILLDLDLLKQVNDQYGYKLGDEVIVKISRQIKTSLRICDHVGRIDGKTFAIILPNTELTGGIKVAEKFRQHLEQAAISINNHQVKLTGSFGVCDLTAATAMHQEQADFNTLLNMADIELYKAKESRNCVKPNMPV